MAAPIGKAAPMGAFFLRTMDISERSEIVFRQLQTPPACDI